MAYRSSRRFWLARHLPRYAAFLKPLSPRFPHSPRGGRAIQYDDLVAPVELVRLAGGKAQRHVGLRRRATPRHPPAPGIAAHRVVPALVAEAAQLLKQPDQRQPLPRGLRLVCRQHAVEIGLPRPELGPRLDLALILEGGGPGPQHPAHGVARHLEVAGDLLDPLALDVILPPDPADRLHNQHPPTTRLHPKAGSLQSTDEGVKIGRRSPLNGGQFSTPN